MPYLSLYHIQIFAFKNGEFAQKEDKSVTNLDAQNAKRVAIFQQNGV